MHDPEADVGFDQRWAGSHAVTLGESLPHFVGGDDFLVGAAFFSSEGEGGTVGSYICKSLILCGHGHLGRTVVSLNDDRRGVCYII